MRITGSRRKEIRKMVFEAIRYAIGRDCEDGDESILKEVYEGIEGDEIAVANAAGMEVVKMLEKLK